MKIVTIDKYILKIGKNENENDSLLNESDENHIWFHLANLPSCHGILNCTYDNLSPKIVFIAACQIKKNTKYKKSRDIKVNYTELKNIEKLEKPGLVKLLKKPNCVNV